MRTLFYVPTLHTVQETLASSIAKEHRKLPPDMARDHAAIMRTWRSVWRTLERLMATGELKPKRLHVFSDGVPTRPGSLFTARITTSVTMQYINRLYRLGANRRGTEHRDFMLVHALHIMRGPRDAKKRRLDSQFERDIMLTRDLFVAMRMIKRVPGTDDALLFMGERHQVDRYVRKLSPDTRIIRLEHFSRLRHRLESF